MLACEWVSPRTVFQLFSSKPKQAIIYLILYCLLLQQPFQLCCRNQNMSLFLITCNIIWFSQHIQKNTKIINYSFLIVVRQYNIKTQKLSNHLDGCQTARTAFNHLLGFCFVSGLRISLLAHFIWENELHI